MDLLELLPDGPRNDFIVVCRALEQCLSVSDGGGLAIEDPHAGTIGLFGVASDRPGIPFGVPWLLGSKHLSSSPRWLVKQGRAYVKQWLERWPVLQNFCLRGNTDSVNWLTSIGFTFDSTITDNGGRCWLHFIQTREDGHV